MFRFILFGRQSPTVAELQHALAVPDGPFADVTENSFQDRMIMGIEKRVIHCGRNFLEIQGRDARVQVMHQTARAHMQEVEGFPGFEDVSALVPALFGCSSTKAPTSKPPNLSIRHYIGLLMRGMPPRYSYCSTGEPISRPEALSTRPRYIGLPRVVTLKRSRCSSIEEQIPERWT
ncbi:hypothetical protein BZA05DRAFT_416775 [Tricharina praecox]|uniref:uncharacterized protein n=1 Tax=Tricharina praecox TaxID=43433 RepID=UPI00221FEBDD|nr:uncharacterized protein BZA05DRAFT_416775 [Tricharina praecox]KAI5855183.1 hypothetical protein BZA05DRAFT_416775 [Tricharina praecox]